MKAKLVAGNAKKTSTHPVHVRPVAFKKLQRLVAQRVIELDKKQHSADVIEFLLDFYEKDNVK